MFGIAVGRSLKVSEDIPDALRPFGGQLQVARTGWTNGPVTARRMAPLWPLHQRIRRPPRIRTIASRSRRVRVVRPNVQIFPIPAGERADRDASIASQREHNEFKIGLIPPTPSQKSLFKSLKGLRRWPDLDGPESSRVPNRAVAPHFTDAPHARTRFAEATCRLHPRRSVRRYGLVAVSVP
jgi:hypothetical protein